MTLSVVFTANQAKSQDVNPQGAATPADFGSLFNRWFGRPPTTPQVGAPQVAAAPPAAAAQTAQRARKPRMSRTRTTTRPVAAQPAPAEQQAAPQQRQVTEPDWPNAAANVGGAMIAPLTVKTVREQLEPEPDSQLVSENELSDIDRAAQPAIAETAIPEPAITTDGSSAFESVPTEQARVFAMSEAIMGEAMKAVTQSAWLEPLLLVLAGALAAMTAMRVFA